VEQKKKVLIITYYWPPSGGAGVQRWLKFAKYLPEFDIEPIILTVDPKNASYTQIDCSLEEEISNGLKVFKTKSFEPLNILSSLFGKKNVPYGGFSNVNKKSFFQTVLRFIRGNFFIPDARIGWNRFAYKKAKEIIIEQNIDTIITTSPPHSTQLVGLKLKRKLGIKWVADFRDPWTDIYYYEDLLHLPIIKRIDKGLERKVLLNADCIIANCKSNKDLLRAKLDAGNHYKFYSITNGFDEDDFKFKSKNPELFTLTYIGSISEKYDPEVIFKVLEKIKKEGHSFKFKVVGSIAPPLINQIKTRGISDNFEFISYLPHKEAIQQMKESSALLYIFPKTDNDKGIAGKLFEYLASERPILAIGPKNGDSYKVIEESQAGKMFERDQEYEIYNFLISVIKGTYKINSQEKINQFTRKILTRQLSEIISKKELNLDNN